MSEYPSLIEPQNITSLLKTAELVCKQGEDSLVYKLGDQVVKKYPNIDIEKLILYQEITNASQKIIDEEELSTFGNFSISINPIDKVIESPDFDVYSISPFVDGHNLQDALNNKSISIEDAQLIKQKLQEISIAIIKQLNLKGINIIPWNVIVCHDKNKTKLVVTDLCQRIGELNNK